MVAIIISSVSTAIAFFALGWNIYRDIIAKPKMKTHAGIYDLKDQSGTTTKTVFIVSATNWGPEEIVIEKTITKKTQLFKKKRLGIIIPDTPINQVDHLPKRLKVGDTVQQFFPYEKNNDILKISRIGFCDSFGKYHWANRKSFSQALIQWKKDFYSTGATSFNSK